jgi:hypothetical protein
MAQHPAIFSNSLQINEQLTTPGLHHLDQENFPFYKHGDYYSIPEELQEKFGTNFSLLVIYHSRSDIRKETCLLNFNRNFGDFTKILHERQLAANTPFVYLIEQSLDGKFEQFHLCAVTNGMEIGGKHYLLAQELGILSRIVEAGELMQTSDGTFEFNDLTGTFIYFDERNKLVPKDTPINQYFEMLGEINGVTFRRVRKALINKSITIEDIHRFSSTDRVFCNVPRSECDKSNCEIVRQVETSGIPLKNILSQHFDTSEIVMRPEVGKIISAEQLRKQRSSHYGRPIGNFLQSQTIDNAQDLAFYWPKIIAGSEIPREDFEKIIEEFKAVFKIKMTVEMFLGPSGNIFVKELPDAIKQMLD